MDKATLFARVSAAYDSYSILDRVAGNGRFSPGERDAIVNEALEGGITADELVAAHDLARESGTNGLGDAFRSVEAQMRAKATRTTQFAADAVNTVKDATARKRSGGDIFETSPL